MISPHHAPTLARSLACIDCDRACVVTMMLKSAIYDTIELGKDKIRKDRDENQTPCDDYARPLG